MAAAFVQERGNFTLVDAWWEERPCQEEKTWLLRGKWQRPASDVTADRGPAYINNSFELLWLIARKEKLFGSLMMRIHSENFTLLGKKKWWLNFLDWTELFFWARIDFGKQKTVTSMWYIEQCQPQVIESKKNMRPKSRTDNWYLHQDNIPAHHVKRLHWVFDHDWTETSSALKQHSSSLWLWIWKLSWKEKVF